MIHVELNGRTLPVSSLEDLDLALDDIDAERSFELWVSVPAGPALCMLRNGTNAWLTYLGEPGDPGWHSVGDASREGEASYTLTSGQVDAYPLSWCVDVEDCYRAVASFYVNDGERPTSWFEWVDN